MRKSNQYTEQAFNDDEAIPEFDQDGIAVRIKGLIHLRDDTFRIMGVKPREIDWQGLFRAIGEPEDSGVDERLACAIGSAIRRHDFMAILADRMLVD